MLVYGTRESCLKWQPGNLATIFHKYYMLYYFNLILNVFPARARGNLRKRLPGCQVAMERGYEVRRTKSEETTFAVRSER